MPRLLPSIIRTTPIFQTHTLFHRSTRLKPNPILLKTPKPTPIFHSHTTISRTMSTYRACIPLTLTSVPPSVLKFYEKFYATSDDPSSSAHSAYVSAFTSSATLIMGTKTAKGSEELMELRKGLWSGPVKTRLHTVEKIFSFDNEGKEVMLYGNVKYGLKNGKEVRVDWAGRATLEGTEEGGEVKMGFYQVYLDSAPVANAMKD